MKNTFLKRILFITICFGLKAFADNFANLQKDLNEPVQKSQVCDAFNGNCQRRFTFKKPEEPTFWQTIKKVLH